MSAQNLGGCAFNLGDLGKKSLTQPRPVCDSFVQVNASSALKAMEVLLLCSAGGDFGREICVLWEEAGKGTKHRKLKSTVKPSTSLQTTD